MMLSPWQNFQTSPFALRPAYNSSTKEIKVRVNQFRIEEINCVSVWQYDVSLPFAPLGSLGWKCF